MDKASKNARKAMERRDFHKLQMKEMAARKQSFYDDNTETVAKNMELLKVCVCVCVCMCVDPVPDGFRYLFSVCLVNTLYPFSTLG